MKKLALFFETRKYLAYANGTIVQAEDPTLPSCKAVLMHYIKRNMKKAPLKEPPKNPARSSSILVYHIALELVDSARFRDRIGFLTSQGQQLLHICRWCLEHFEILNYISEEELIEHRAFLDECEIDSARYRAW